MRNSITKKQLREFGILLGLGIPFLLGFLMPLISGHTFKQWTILVSVPFLIFGILSPKVLFYPYKAWMEFGKILGWINSRVILGLVFVSVLIPIAFLMKIFGYDPLRIKKKNKETYLENKTDHQVDLKRIF